MKKKKRKLGPPSSRPSNAARTKTFTLSRGKQFLILLFAVPWLILAWQRWAPNGPAPAPEPPPAIQLPRELKGEPGVPVRLQAESRGTLIRWRSPNGVYLISQPDPLAVVVVAPQAGVYEIFAWTAVDGEPTEAAACRIVIGNVPPPKPEPEPTPPAPTPVPTDPFQQTLGKVWTAELGPERARYRKLLVELYRTAARDVAVSDKKTLVEFYQVVLAAGRSLLGDNLSGLRDAVGEELNKVLPRQAGQPLDAATRELCARHFTRVADALARLPD